MGIMSDIIDLCSSDDEDSAALKPRPSMDNNESPRKTFVTPDIHTKNAENDEEQRNRKKPRSLFHYFESSDDDSSDGDLYFQPFRNNQKSKAVAAKALPVSETNISTASCPKAKESTNEGPKIKAIKPIIANPYAKKAAKENSKGPIITNPYAKRPPISNIPYNDRYPIIDRGSGRYEDLRVKYILGFWAYSQTLVHASYNLTKLDRFAKRINALALSQFPIRSLEELCYRFEKRADISIMKQALDSGDLLRKQAALESGNLLAYNEIRHEDDGRYFSICEACLVSLLEHVESEAKDKKVALDSLQEEELLLFLKESSSWVFLSDLLPMIDSRLKKICPGSLVRKDDEDNGAGYYEKKTTRSAEYRQVEKLQSKTLETDTSYIKPHKREKKTCFELTLLGYNTAIRIRRRTFPASPGHYRVSNLIQVEPRFDGICLAVDMREGGGPTNKLHVMCNKLDMLKMPYFVCTLNIGDYCFFAGNKILPVLIERKSIEDVAQSIYDGRWERQKHRMYQGQYVFGYGNCRMAYIIEGEKGTQLLTGDLVGQTEFNVTGDRLDKEIEQLGSQGFDVLQTITPEHSMVELSRWGVKVLQDYRKGLINATLSHNEFLEEVKKIPRNTDFSRIAQDMAASISPARLETGDEESPTSNAKMPRQTTLNPVKSKYNIKSYEGWTVARLKEECAKFGLPRPSKKADLITILNGPRPPPILVERKRRGEAKGEKYYAPSQHNNPDTCGTALLVALFLEQRKESKDWKGLTKDRLYSLAEALDIARDPFSKKSGLGYDGWSAMGSLRKSPLALVVLERGHFKLTTSCDISGYPVAEALHRWCHEHDICRCQELGYDFQL